MPQLQRKYTGQTGRLFRIRFQEHIRDSKYNNSRAKFAQDLIDNKHAIRNMEDIMEIIHVTGKGKKLDALESFHIYKEAKAGNQINDKLTVRGNELFETIIQQDPYEGHSTTATEHPKRAQS